MYSLIYSIYFFMKRLQKKYSYAHKKFPAVFQKTIDYCEWYYNILFARWVRRFPARKCGINRQHRERKIIVSLTSYPKRIHTVWLTIETLLRQSVKPDQIILWLAGSQFENLECLPLELLRLQERGLTIRFCDDLLSHKKYMYVMQEHPDDLIILVDDDMFYPKDTIKKLLQLHQEFPQDICTMTAQYIWPSFQSMPSLWRNPKLYEHIKHSDRLQIFTGSGSLYPPGSLDQTAFDKGLAMRLCPYADDLWLTFMARRRGTKITMQNPWRAFPVTIYGTNVGSLWYINAQDNKNDDQWKHLMQYFCK